VSVDKVHLIIRACARLQSRVQAALAAAWNRTAEHPRFGGGAVPSRFASWGGDFGPLRHLICGCHVVFRGHAGPGRHDRPFGVRQAPSPEGTAILVAHRDQGVLRCADRARRLQASGSVALSLLEWTHRRVRTPVRTARAPACGGPPTVSEQLGNQWLTLPRSPDPAGCRAHRRPSFPGTRSPFGRREQHRILGSVASHPSGRALVTVNRGRKVSCG